MHLGKKKYESRVNWIVNLLSNYSHYLSQPKKDMGLGFNLIVNLQSNYSLYLSQLKKDMDIGSIILN